MPRRGRLTMAGIRTARRVALALAAVLVVLLGVLWYLGRRTEVELPPVDDKPMGGGRQVGKGIDHTFTHEGRPLLRIRGKRDRYDRAGALHVEEVLISAYQQDGSRYELAADKATYNVEKREAVLAGRVSLVGPEGFSLRTKKLLLKQGGRWLISETQVNFQWGTDPPLAGRAQKLSAQLNRGEFHLTGGVGIRAMRGGEGEPFGLSADRLVLERKLHQLRADGRVQLKHGRSHVRADRLAAHLAPSDNRLQFVRARWHVHATLLDADEAGRNRYLVTTGDDLSVLFDEAGRLPTRIELAGEGKAPAHLRRGVDGGAVFDVQAPRVEAEMAAGRLSAADARGGVKLVEEGPGVPARRVSARHAHANFGPEGTLARLEVDGAVTASEAGRGDIAADQVIVTPERTEATGKPARLQSPRGELRAPRLVYTAAEALAHASGGVEATLAPGKDNPMQDTPLAEGDEPVQVQAEEGFWRDQPRSFVFKGKVRAWSGDRVLRTDQLRGDVEEQRLTGAGGVQTVWFLPPPEGEAAGQPAAARQVRVDADTLLYSDREHRLVYDGNVKVVDSQRRMQSKVLAVELDEDGEARRMQATGGVQLEAPAEGRTINAEQADYDVQARRILFVGSPVKLVDAKGGSLSGRQAVYSMATGKVRVTAELEEVAKEEGP